MTDGAQLRHSTNKIQGRYLLSACSGSSFVWSPYSGLLSASSAIFSRPGDISNYYYYQALRVEISITGRYSFTSVSSIDTYGYLYNALFDPSDSSQNFIASDDDNAGGFQFLLTEYLSSTSTYVLLVTTFSPRTTGSFSIRVSGPSSPNLTSFTPVTSRPITTRGELIIVSSLFYTSLVKHSRRHDYEGILFTVKKKEGAVSGRERSWLSVTDSAEWEKHPHLDWRTPVIGRFRERLSSICWFRLVTTPTALNWNYAGSLSLSSPVFFRPYGNENKHYRYQALRVVVEKTGRYIFTSNSAMDTYGYFYENSVDPSNPTDNLRAHNDDDDGNQQFRIAVELYFGRTYFLLVTTFRADVVGAFRIRVSNPTSINLIGFTPSTSRPIRTTSECIASND